MLTTVSTSYGGRPAAYPLRAVRAPCRATSGRHAAQESGAPPEERGTAPGQQCVFGQGALLSRRWSTLPLFDPPYCVSGLFAASQVARPVGGVIEVKAQAQVRAPAPLGRPLTPPLAGSLVHRARGMHTLFLSLSVKMNP